MKYALIIALLALSCQARADDGYRYKPPVNGPVLSDTERSYTEVELPGSASTPESRREDAAAAAAYASSEKRKADILRRLDESNHQYARDNPGQIAKPMTQEDEMIQVCINFRVRTPGALRQCVAVASRNPGDAAAEVQRWRVRVRRACAEQALELESCEYKTTGISSY